MREWINYQWKLACDGNMMLVLDVHKAQKTPGVLQSFSESQTSTIYVPAGTTGLVQPLDVCFNAPFKAAVKRLAEEHVHDNLEDYVHGSIPASTRRILFTKWVGKAWEQISSNRDNNSFSFHYTYCIPVHWVTGFFSHLEDFSA